MARRPDDAAMIETIYGAAIEPTKWIEVLQALMRLCGADSAAMTTQHVATGTGTRVTVGYAEADRPRYFDGFSTLNPLFKQLLQKPLGVPHPHQTLVDDTAFRRGRYFNEYCRPNGLYFMAGLIIDRQDDAVEWLTLNRDYRGSAYHPQALRPLTRLVPHIRRASKISLRLKEARAGCMAWEASLDALAHALVVLDQHGRVVFANRTVRALAAARDGFILRADGVSAPAASSALAQLIAHATRGDSNGVRTGGNAVLPRRIAPLPLSASIIPLPSENAWPMENIPSALLLIVDPAHPVRLNAALLMAMFGLTEREAELATLLASGHNLDVAAGCLGVGRETARTHLARALAKTGSARQADLVRLVLTTAPPANAAS